MPYRGVPTLCYAVRKNVRRCAFRCKACCSAVNPIGAVTLPTAPLFPMVFTRVRNLHNRMQFCFSHSLAILSAYSHCHNASFPCHVERQRRQHFPSLHSLSLSMQVGTTFFLTLCVASRNLRGLLLLRKFHLHRLHTVVEPSNGNRCKELFCFPLLEDFNFQNLQRSSKF